MRTIGSCELPGGANESNSLQILLSAFTRTGCRHFRAFFQEHGYTSVQIVKAFYAGCVALGDTLNRRCFECERLGPEVYACLECIFLGCRGAHLNRHMRPSKHAITLDLFNNVIYCTSCREISPEPPIGLLAELNLNGCVGMDFESSAPAEVEQPKAIMNFPVYYARHDNALRSR